MLDWLQRSTPIEFTRAVINHGKHLRHWHLRGTIGHSPFSPWEEFPWDQLQGAIMFGLTAERIGLVETTKVPTVNFRPDELGGKLPVVTDDFEAVGRLGAQHLLERGYPHYAYVGDGSWKSNLQFQGFAETLHVAGHACGELVTGRGGADENLSLVREWLESLPRPVAVMAERDYLAGHVVNAAADVGLNVPGDVGTVGVNNNLWVSIMAATPISSIQLDDRRLGRRVARTLDDLMLGRPVEPMQCVVPLRVATRESTSAVVASDPVAARALQFIRDHADRAITVEDVLTEVRCSRSKLEGRLKAAVGCTVHLAITRARVDRVKMMLQETDLTLEQIAHRCGFPHPPRLHESFKRVTGITPAAYRNQMRNAATP